MQRYRMILTAALVLASVSLQACGAQQQHRCNSSSPGCMALWAQQSKTGTIAGQHARCCG